jgi:hypothetical protein
VIAGAANEIVQAGSFASEDNYGIGREVVAVVILGAALVEADDPEIALFEGFQSADEVDNASEAEMLGGSGGGFDGDGAERSRAALGEENAIDTGAFGRPQEGTEVLRIFDAVEGENEAGGGAFAGAGEQIFEGEEVPFADDGEDALVGGGLGESGEGVARLGADIDAGFAAQGGNGGEAGVLTAAEALGGEADVVEAASAGAQRFFDGMKAVEDLHCFSSLSLLRILNRLILEELQAGKVRTVEQRAGYCRWM